MRRAPRPGAVVTGPQRRLDRVVKAQHHLVMPHARVNGVELYHDVFGDAADPTIALVSGLGTQCVEWDAAFCGAIAERGFHVLRFDNRDVGLSTHLDDQPVNALDVLRSVGAGEAPEVPYLLHDMAADLAGLLDHLGVDRAHVVGASMGGMIAQTFAIEHPDRARSLTSIMSTTGDPDVGQPTAEAMAALVAPPARSAEEAGEHKVHHAHVWGSPAFIDEARLRKLGADAWNRRHDPHGVARQLAAIAASGTRSAGLAELSIPTLVIHGTVDRLVAPSGGERTAEVVPDAKLLMIEGMGHDLPPQLWPQVTDAIVAHATENP
jgi:pimeloyl-ACP methyl ester carboxylesterase